MTGIAGCPVCGSATAGIARSGTHEAWVINCKRCGDFDITGSADGVLRLNPACQDLAVKAALSHAVRSLVTRATGRRPMLNTDIIIAFLKEAMIKNPLEQLDNLILWLGQNRLNPAAGKIETIGGLLSIIGARHSIDDWNYIIKYTHDIELIELYQMNIYQGDILDTLFTLKLTFPGWEKYQNLQTASSNSRKAFMAMKFGDTVMDRIYRDHFQPAVAVAGFTLTRVDEGQGAGLIDDQMLVAIRTSRFLMADLSAGNQGAYWEAGFAEGLGKPVIYLCSKAASEDPSLKPHFDTNHRVTIYWDEADMEQAMRKITAEIRNTFPVDSIIE